MIYVEESLLGHPQVEAICSRLKRKKVIPIGHYGEVFNRHGQNFRLQKKNPAFILARKTGKRVYEIPPNYGIGAPKNFYFSHVLNCPFDCSYCFLQGMYRSAHHVLFVNFDEFQDELEEKIGPEKTTFFSGYDGDSLALDTYTGFLDAFLPFFESRPLAELELRTKSTNIKKLLSTPPLPNVVVAFSLNPAGVIQTLEKKTPSLQARLSALQKLQAHGWPIGLRFDPILFIEDFETHYSAFFNEVFSALNPERIHSVTLGTFRLPKPTYKAMSAVKPRDSLLAQCTELPGNLMGISQEEDLLAFCEDHVLKFINQEKVFLCR